MSKNKQNGIEWAHALVQEWFLAKFGAPTEPQVQGWPSILEDQSTLICAPTGSGKTLAAFLACLDGLVRQALDGSLADETEVLYVSPLKALSNDIQKNLMQPLAEIAALAESHGFKMQEIRVAVRTGDTPAYERQKMLKKPPHIIVTTPESLYILLTAEKSRKMLQTIHTVIVDEIHAVADDKRGAHLALSLERLEAITPHSPIRIGLSATQKPIELVAAFLTGKRPQETTIIDIGYNRKLDIAIDVPSMPLTAVASLELWEEIYAKIAEYSQNHRSILVFVNTRKLAERVAHHLSDILGHDLVCAHHGSLSRKLRLAAETKLKNGELKVLVATASLELGIDIGSVDLVCQIGSPRAIAVGLQRIGRAGHWRGAISKGRIFATTRDELLECGALVYAIGQRKLDQLIIPEQPMDILAQQMVACCATQDWQEEALYHLLKKAYPYQNLTRLEFFEVLTMLADGMAGSRGRYGTYLFWDRVNHIIKARRGARLTAVTSGGAIPDTGLFTVLAEPDGLMVGTLDEDFAIDSSRGDIILLGTTSWRINKIEAAKGRVFVEDAHGAPPNVPFWRGEAPGRTPELSSHVAQLRQTISDFLPEVKVDHFPPEAIEWLMKQCKISTSAAEQLLEYIQEGKTVLGAVPTQKTIIAERFFDEGGGMQLVIHAPFGAKINKAWGLALRKKFCRSFNFELQAAATDDGLNIALAEQHSFPLADVFNFLHPNSLKAVLTQAVLQSPIFGIRWRAVATRSLALPRFRAGKKVPPHILRMLSDDLLAAVFPDAAACQDNLGGRDIELPNHPLTNETIKDALTETLDVDGLIELIQAIQNNEIKCLAVDTPVPSVFSHEILNANPYAYLDDAPLEERRARAVEMRRTLPDSVLNEIGKLDPQAIMEVQQQAWPDIRNEDELHDFLQTLIVLPKSYILKHENWDNFFQVLLTQKRVLTAEYNQQTFCIAMEKYAIAASIYPNLIFNENLVELDVRALSYEDNLQTLMRGWMQHLGPTTKAFLSQELALPIKEVDLSLLALESTGLILRGQFTQTNELEWCERRLLARIHRLTVGRLRKEIEPVTALQFMYWLLEWQHVAPNTQLRGEHGLLEVIRQLQGFEIPANAWESQIFSKRIQYYDKALLDHLCLTGVVGWGRLSPHPALVVTSKETVDEHFNRKRVMPTSVAPITFFVRAEADWMPNHPILEVNELQGLGHVARSIYAYLKDKGASFFTDMVRSGTYLKSEVETGLWQLVSAGLITADGFDNLRALIDPKRRLDYRGRRMRPRHSTGRWSILQMHEVPAAERIEALAWLLLRRYGVVYRDLLSREKNLPAWRDLLKTFRRLEDKGEIRGGRFVDGFLGEQFALPYAVESLRASKRKLMPQQAVEISASDPLNLIGVILPGERVPALSGRKVAITTQTQV